MKIPFYRIELPEECEKEVLETIRSGWLTNGPKTIALEERFKEMFGKKYALATNSGTAGLHLAIKSLSLNPGDKVVVPTLTFTATANAVLYNDLKVVFSDVDGQTYNIDPNYLEKLLTDDHERKIKAVIIVHMAGVPVDMEKIFQLKTKFGFFLIEDATHCLPGKWSGQPLGGLSDIGVFSFNPTKNVPGADGGIVVLDCEKKYEQMKIWRSYGVDRDSWKRSTEKERGWNYDVVDLGYKYNASDLSSAVVLAQLPKLEENYRRKLRIVEKYNRGLQDLKDVKLPFNAFSLENSSSWHLYILQVSRRDELYQHLLSVGIHTNVHYKPLHLHSFWKDYSKGISLPVAEDVFQRILTIPLYHTLSDEEVDFIVAEIINFYR